MDHKCLLRKWHPIEGIKFYLRRHEVCISVLFCHFEIFRLEGQRTLNKNILYLPKRFEIGTRRSFCSTTKTENRMNFNIDLCRCNIFHIFPFPLFLVSRQLEKKLFLAFFWGSKQASMEEKEDHKLPFISIVLHFPNSSAVIKGNYSEHR